MEVEGATREVLTPIRSRKGHFSVVQLPEQWFIVATSAELGETPIARELFGTKLVLFREKNGAPAALLDRCPHRNVPLSLGKVASDGTLECAYHGWRFDGTGACRFIPSLGGESDAKARRAGSYLAREQDGFVWVYYALGAEEAKREPHRFALSNAPGYGTVRHVAEAEGTLYSTIENALDVPHTAYLHKGLFRNENRGLTITAKVHRGADRVEAEYLGEPRPPGIVGTLLSPSGGMVQHFDRFLLPSIAQVEYRIGAENHILVDSVMTPVNDFFTRIYAVVSFRTRIPHWLLQPFIKPLALRIFAQDANILRAQTATVRELGGEQFASTEIDVLGKHIWRLLRAAERGDYAGAAETEEVALLL